MSQAGASASDQSNPLPPDRRMPRSEDDPLTPNAGETVGEYIEIDLDDGSEPILESTEDGGIIVTLGQAAESKGEGGEFFANLADGILPDRILSKICTSLMEKIELDKEARKKRDEQQEEAIKRTGFGKDAPGGADFDGASRVVHPMLAEAAIDYESRIMKELWPVAGPVKQKIVGEPTLEKAKRAKRKVEFMNFQLTEQIKEARDTMESMLTQVPMGGLQFIRQWWDHRLKRPRWDFVPVDRVYLPENAASYYSSHRRTFSETISGITYKDRINQGLYKDYNLSAPSQMPEKSRSQKANEKVEGVDESGMNPDQDREMLESMTYLEVDEEMATALGHEEKGELYPYLITIEANSKKIVSMYRDWEEKDEAREPIDHMFEFPFLRWRGAYAIGLPQVIGGLSSAATGALRALLDSAQISNAQGGLILKGSGIGGQSVRPAWGEFAEVDSTIGTDDIRKQVMPFATKEPSNVLFQLLGFLVEAGKGTIRTSLDETTVNSNTNVPVGTQLSRVEEGLVVFSSIHGRIHAAFDRLLLGLHRLNRLYLPEVIRVDAQGREIQIRRADFDGPIDVRPVSDPTIYSDQQRMAQVQAIQQRAVVAPQLYNLRAVEQWFLELMKVPEPDRFLAPAPQPHELNAVNENLAMTFGSPVTAFPEQDHLSHLQAHLDFLQSPIFGQSPLLMAITPQFLPAMSKHLLQHLVFQYVKMTNNVVKAAAGVDAVELMSNDDHVKAEFDKLLALVSQKVVMPASAQMFQQIMPIFAGLAQKLGAMQPKPPMDPAMAAVQAAAAETQRKGTADQATAQLKAQELAASQQNDAARNASDQQRNAIMAERNQVTQDIATSNQQAQLQRTELEADSARDIASMKVETGRGTGLSDGASFEGG